MDSEWHSAELQDLMHKFESSEKGLSDAQVQHHLQEYGQNKLKEERRETIWHIFFSQFKDILILILIIAAIVAAIAGEVIDSIVISFILILNAILGTVQEGKAAKALDALRKMTALQAKVIRNGKEQMIDSIELVPGDIIILESGDKIPADARLIVERNLHVDEASLTGESTPVSKDICKVAAKAQVPDRKNMVFMGTTVTTGYAQALIVATGMGTQMGKIASMVQVKEDMTPLQKRMKEFGKHIAVFIAIVSAIIFAIDIVEGQPFVESFLVVISLAVSAIPEGLPAVITLTLALGMNRMVKRKVLIRKLASVETLGSTTVICADKTGTMTKNEMTVKEIYLNQETIKVTGHGFAVEGEFFLNDKKLEQFPEELDVLMSVGVVCNNAKLEEGKYFGDPTEAALLVLGAKAGITQEALQVKLLDELSFDSTRKMMTMIGKIDKDAIAYVKGAPEELLEKCTAISEEGKVRKLTEQDRKKILAINEGMAKRALRVLGFAYRTAPSGQIMIENTEKDLTFVGLAGMIDLPREGVKEAIDVCKQAGIRVIMITGDHRATAEAIAAEIGLRGKSLTGEEVQDMTDEQFEKALDYTNIFARVAPETKVRILKALKAKGEVVAMSGDGVNDAPALKAADIGVAMGIKGTDVTKEASNMVITDDHFSSIVAGIEEGRIIFSNIKKFIRYLLSANFAALVIVGATGLLGLPLPLAAIQILWLNLVTDGAPALALAVNPPEKNIMKGKPLNPKANILKKMMPYLLATTIVYAIAGFFIYFHYLNAGADLVKLQTMVFTTAVIFELFLVFNIKSNHEWGYRHFFSNQKLVLAVATSVLLQLAVLYIPFLQPLFKTTALGMKDWLFVILAASPAILLTSKPFKLE